MPPSTANEVLILFSQALSSPSESEQQANILIEVKQAIEAEPSLLPVLYSTILSVASRAGPLLKRWIANIVEFTVARLVVIPSPISPEQRAHRGLLSISPWVFQHVYRSCLCMLCLSFCTVLRGGLDVSQDILSGPSWRESWKRVRRRKEIYMVVEE